VFGNLHMLENLQLAKGVLNGHSGIYAFVHIVTGTSYIGSSMDLAGRIMNHILGHSSNLHLQSAILKHGLCKFAFVILEYCILSDLLKREQHFLDILFSLVKELRYNFNPTADSRLGATHTPESKAKTSDSISGANNPMYGRTGANHPMFGRTGANNPMYGKVPATAMTVKVYSLDNVLVHSFSSQVAAAEWLGVSRTTVQNYVRSGSKAGF
jgi:group I intron endonuclease